MMFEVAFWLFVTLTAYTYAGYPLVIVIASIFARNRNIQSSIEPYVSILISAYNEEKDIQAKLTNCFQLEYPKKKLEIVVASDGSTDSTDDIVRKNIDNTHGIRVVLHRVEGRLGKTAAQNSAVKVCNGEIIIFSDAASMYDTGAVKAFVRNYADPNVGAVSGMYTYIDEGASSAGLGTKMFWMFENVIKSRQTRIKTITGCSGCIYSLRRELYTELPPEIISDLVEPLTILKKGYRIVFEPKARAVEEPAGNTNDEFKMRVRVIVRGMNGMLYMRSLFNPVKYPFVSFQLISHKLMRWFVPIFAIVIFTSNAMLVTASLFYLITFILQIIFYILAALGYFLEKKGFHKFYFYLPLYFCTVNLASLISMLKVMRRENIVTWQTKR